MLKPCHYRDSIRYDDVKGACRLCFMVKNFHLYNQLKIQLGVWHERLFSGSESGVDFMLCTKAVSGLYRILKKQEPLLFICQSPFQLARIPPVIACLRNSKEWFQLSESLKAHKTKAGSRDWEKLFNAEWKKIERYANRLDQQINGNFVWAHKTLKANCRARLKTFMHDLLLLGGELKEPLFELADSSRIKSNPDYLKSNVSDPDFFKHRLALQMKIEQAARLRLRPETMFQNLFLGNFDARLLTQFAPVAGRFLSANSDNDCKIAAQLKLQCLELELRAGRLASWYANLPLTRRGESAFQSLWNAQLAEFIPFALSCSCINTSFFSELQEEIDCMAYLLHAACAYYFTEDICYVCPPPLILRTDANLRVHCDDDPAAVWPDGLNVFSWKGNVLPAQVIKEKHKISCQKIKRCHNIERRRILIDIFGEARFLQEANAKLISEDSCGTLYRLELPPDEPIVMVKVKNSTPEPDGSFKNYFLRVPPDMVRPRQAVAWTFNLREKDYLPAAES